MQIEDDRTKKLELPVGLKVGEECPECKKPNARGIVRRFGSKLVRVTEEDYTVKQKDFYKTKEVDSPQSYAVYAKLMDDGLSYKARLPGRHEKNQFFSSYMKEGVSSTIWNPKKATFGSNNLDKRFCTACKEYSPYVKGSYLGGEKKCYNCSEETRHPYYVWNVINGNRHEDDEIYDTSWWEKTRGQMHPTWGHQLPISQIAEIAKACGFHLSPKDQEAPLLGQ